MPTALPRARQPEVFRKTGRAPFKVRRSGGSDTTVAVLDADNNPLFICSPELAGRIVGAVNLVECAHPIERGDGRMDEQS